MQLNSNINHSCFNIIIDSCLRRFGFNEVLFWNQIGLYYKKENTNITLISSYKTFSETLPMYGLAVEEKFYTNVNEFLSDIKNYLRTGISIGLEVDAYELPYCLSYRQQHLLHTFEIEGITKNAVKIVDHYYRYKGTVNWDILTKTFDSTRKHFRTGPSLFTLKKSGVLKINSPKKSIQENIKALNGEIKYSNTDNTGISGLKAISSIKNDVINIISSTENQQESTSMLSEYFSKLKEVANSRYNFKNYLSYYNLKDAADLSEVSYQNWMAFANIILRFLYMKNKDTVKEKLNYRAHKIIENEHTLLKLLEKAELIG
ncbi:hypothetical protein [Bacillus sp. 166amftsu]|uniref:hypothetical protein n=1 Tax=Bacillus sp. 166amftsu TaxID=1761753 RepID=UPI00089A8B39|nr:hypothetical protein [Bacillus sp. 166amftsu]SDZ37921.1 hypothetical protein SAMN04488156_12249 [Bacillus sp. 166amftsu]